jgi:hypothetical protein
VGARCRHWGDGVCCRRRFFRIFPVLLIGAYFFFSTVSSWWSTYSYFHHSSAIRCPTVGQKYYFMIFLWSFYNLKIFLHSPLIVFALRVVKMLTFCTRKSLKTF